MKIVAISDTHGEHRSLTLPGGDMLVHAGDLSVAGEQQQIEDFVEWFSATDYEHKVFIAGNHDSWAEHNNRQMQSLADACKVTYLNGSQTTIAGVKIWGSPMTPRFMDWSFMLDQGDEIARHWAAIPDDTDLLITHGPPFGILDEIEPPAAAMPAEHKTAIERVGCPSLSRRVSQVAPRLHLFGHIHECYGQSNNATTHFVNASNMNRDYILKNPPVVLDYPKLAEASGSRSERQVDTSSITSDRETLKLGEVEH